MKKLQTVILLLTVLCLLAGCRSSTWMEDAKNAMGFGLSGAHEYLTLDASLYDGLWTGYGILVPRDAVLDEIDTFAYHPKCTRVMTFRETQS